MLGAEEGPDDGEAPAAQELSDGMAGEREQDGLRGMTCPFSDYRIRLLF